MKILEEPKLVVTGFEVRRSDSAPIAKEVQTKIFEMVLKGAKKEEILQYVSQVREDLKAGKYGADSFGLPKGIKKELEDYGKTKKDGTKGSVPPHVRGVEFSKQHLGIRFDQRLKPRMIYVKSMPQGYPTTDVVCFESEKQLPEGIVIDWDKQLQPLLERKVERIVGALGFEKTVSLEGFM